MCLLARSGYDEIAHVLVIGFIFVSKNVGVGSVVGIIVKCSIVIKNDGIWGCSSVVMAVGGVVGSFWSQVSRKKSKVKNIPMKFFYRAALFGSLCGRALNFLSIAS